MKYFLFFLLMSNMYSDEIVLKTKKEFKNIRVKISKDKVEFEENSKKFSFFKSEIKSIKFKPVVLKKAVTKEEILEYEKEKIRVADILQDADFEIDETGKPKLAVLNFTKGAGVSQAEVETLTYLITTKLVKTKLFLITDKFTIDKIIRETTLSCKPTENCDEKIQSKLNSNKILTGVVTKVQNKYFINGNIIDPSEKKIDFAEKEICNGVSEFEKASDNFAKKIAGGILEFWDEAILSKENFRYQPYLIRSAFLPGLGQYKFGSEIESRFQKIKGISIGVLFFASGFYLQNKYKEYDEIEKKVQTSERLFWLSNRNSNLENLFLFNYNSGFENLETKSNEIKNSLGVVGFIYFANLIDIFFLNKQINLFQKTTWNFFPSTEMYSFQNEKNFDTKMNLIYSWRFE